VARSNRQRSREPPELPLGSSRRTPPRERAPASLPNRAPLGDRLALSASSQAAAARAPAALCWGSSRRPPPREREPASLPNRVSGIVESLPNRLPRGALESAEIVRARRDFSAGDISAESSDSWRARIGRDRASRRSSPLGSSRRTPPRERAPAFLPSPRRVRLLPPGRRPPSALRWGSSLSSRAKGSPASLPNRVSRNSRRARIGREPREPPGAPDPLGKEPAHLCRIECLEAHSNRQRCGESPRRVTSPLGRLCRIESRCARVASADLSSPPRRVPPGALDSAEMAALGTSRREPRASLPNRVGPTAARLLPASFSAESSAARGHSIRQRSARPGSASRRAQNARADRRRARIATAAATGSAPERRGTAGGAARRQAARRTAGPGRRRGSSRPPARRQPTDRSQDSGRFAGEAREGNIVGVVRTARVQPSKK